MKSIRFKNNLLNKGIMLLACALVMLAMRSPNALPVYGGSPVNLIDQMYQDLMKQDDGLKKLHESLEDFDSRAAMLAIPAEGRTYEINKYFTEAKQLVFAMKDTTLKKLVLVKLGKSEDALNKTCIDESKKASAQLREKMAELEQLENALKVWVTLDMNEKKCREGMRIEYIQELMKTAKQLEKQLQEKLR